MFLAKTFKPDSMLATITSSLSHYMTFFETLESVSPVYFLPTVDAL